MDAASVPKASYTWKKVASKDDENPSSVYRDRRVLQDLEGREQGFLRYILVILGCNPEMILRWRLVVSRLYHIVHTFVYKGYSQC